LLQWVLGSAFALGALGAHATTYDVIVYGGTSSGVIAAVQAAQMGKKTLLIEPGDHLGGMTASGLGLTDIGDPTTVGGLARTFYTAIDAYYHPLRHSSRSGELVYSTSLGTEELAAPMQWTFEPHVAENLFLAMLSRSGAVCVRQEKLDRVQGVRMINRRILSLRMESGHVYAGRMFIDATYEGDLMAASGVHYRVGRESVEEFDELLAGIFPDTSLTGEVDPYVVPGAPSSGLLPGLVAGSPGPSGAGDTRVQQYNLRLCLTNSPTLRVAVDRPSNYDPTLYELLARYLQNNPDLILGNDIIKFGALPNGKVDGNGTGSFSTDMISDYSEEWVGASYARRAEIFQIYQDYTQGLLWFLANDARVPAAIRAQASTWGLAGDEFNDNGHWPWQLYVRESRRMIGNYIITEHDAEGETTAPDPIALASYGMDSHKVTLFVDATGLLQTEGYFFGAVSPYPISYRAITPHAAECTNLLVSVCLSATHVAFNSIRMEPVYMMLGQAAGTAAGLALEEGVGVQKVDYPSLAARLLADGQLLVPQTSD